MRPHTASDRQRILLLKVTLKLMVLFMAAAVVLVMTRAFLPKAQPPAEPLRVNVAHLEAGTAQGIEWNRRRLLVVHTAAGANYLVILDHDPIYGCPMRWVAAAEAEPPIQPWRGGLRALCTEHWFDAAGTSLTSGVADLKRIPYTLEKSGDLVISAPTK